jgi:aerobic C4-dicarboxylate transport protein
VPSRAVYQSLYFQVLIAIVLGVLLGITQPELAANCKPLADAFIALIKMMIGAIIFCTIVTGISGMGNLKSVGKTGGLALLYFELVSTLALIVGLLVVNLLRPGDGLNVNPDQLDASAIDQYVNAAKNQSIIDFLLHLIPKSLFGAFADGDTLQILVVSLLFGFALHGLGEHGQHLRVLIESGSQVLFRMITMIMRLAPLGAFGAMAYTIGKYGLASLQRQALLMVCFYVTCVFFVFVVLGLIARLHGFSILKYILYIREELFVVLGTSSSESVLPQMMEKLERAGCRRSVVGLVIPTGYSFNLDGTSIYLTMASVFLAQATNTTLSLSQQIGLLAILLLTSKGAAGVTGSGFIVLAATLSATESIPLSSMTLILGIDRFMSEARALTNLVGNGVATIVVSKWCGALDSEQLQRELSGSPLRT